MAAAPALPALLALAGLFLALGMIVMGDAFTRALFQVTASGIGWIPWIGKKAANGVQAVGHRVNAVFSAAALRLEGAISETWHVLATLVEQTGAAIWEAAQVGARALWLVEVKYPLEVLSAIAHKARGSVTIVQKVAGTTVQRVTVVKGITAAQLTRLGRRVHALEARVAAFPAAAAGAIALPFPRIGSLERRARAQGKRLSKLERRLGALGAAALVTGALARLGAGWIRCTNVRKLGRRACATDHDFLDALLAGSLLVVGTISLAQMARELREPTELVMGGLGGLVRELRELG